MLFGNALLFVFVIIEALIIRFKLKKELPYKELIMNLNSGHILLWVLRSLEVSAYALTFKYLSTDAVAVMPYVLVWIIAFFLWDFMFYWLHRTHHYWKILWGIHVVHHEGEHFSLSLGIRNSWYSSLSSFPYFIIMAILGIQPEIFVAVSSIHYTIQFYNHNHLVNRSGFLEKFMVTPAHHRVHHGKNEPYIDKNFGGTFVFWDKLFGTFQLEDAQNPVQIGISHPVESNNPLNVNNVPFMELIRDDYEFESPKVKTNPLTDFILVSGAIVLFMMLLSFIYLQHYLSITHSVILFATIFLGTLSNGLILDGRKIGWVLWLLANITLPIYILIAFSETNSLFNGVTMLFLLHGVYTVYRYLIGPEFKRGIETGV